MHRERTFRCLGQTACSKRLSVSLPQKHKEYNEYKPNEYNEYKPSGYHHPDSFKVVAYQLALVVSVTSCNSM